MQALLGERRAERGVDRAPAVGRRRLRAHGVPRARAHTRAGARHVDPHAPVLFAVPQSGRAGREADEVVVLGGFADARHDRIEARHRVDEQLAVGLGRQAAQRLEPAPNLRQLLAADRCLFAHVRAANVEIDGVHDAVGLCGGGRDQLQLPGHVVDLEPFGEQHDGLASVHRAQRGHHVGQRAQEAARLGVDARHQRSGVLGHLPPEDRKVFGLAGQRGSRAGRGGIGARACFEQGIDVAAEDLLVATRDLVGVVDAHHAERAVVGFLAKPADCHQLAQGLRGVGREVDLGARAR